MRCCRESEPIGPEHRGTTLEDNSRPSRAILRPDRIQPDIERVRKYLLAYKILTDMLTEGQYRAAMAGAVEPQLPMKTVIRLKRSLARIGIVGLVFFPAMLTLSVVAACTDPAASREPVAMLVVGSGWMSFIAISTWLLLAYRRGSIVLADGDVTFTGVWIDRTIRLADVTRARWRRPPASLRLSLGTGVRSVRFGDYPLDRRRELVRYFRDGLDPGLQSGWDEVWERYAGPEEVEGTMREYGASFRKILRLLALGPILGLCGGLILGYVAPGTPTWTGSLSLDWTARGTLVGLGLAVFLWVLQWIDQPERTPSPDGPRGDGDDRNMVPRAG